MKAKIYPLENMKNELTAPASPFSLQVEIICASLAKGTSTIKNISCSKEIDNTIDFCESLGASIKKTNDRIIVKGINNKLGYNNALFDSNDCLVNSYLFIPILCSIPQPFGLKGSDGVLKTLSNLDETLKDLGVMVYHEEGMIRYEEKISKYDCEIDGRFGVAFVTGLFICFALSANTNCKIKLRAPVKYEKTYSEIVRILKKYSIDVKHPNSMAYELYGNQKFRSCKTTTSMDSYLVPYYLLLASKVEGIEKELKINNFVYKKDLGDSRLLKIATNQLVNQKVSLSKNKVFTPKEVETIEIESSSENAIPFLMLVGYISKYKTSIVDVRLSKGVSNSQFDIMNEAFKKLKLQVVKREERIVVGNNKVENKTQVDCKGNRYCAIALTFLALLSKAPITINNIDCINEYSSSLLDNLKELGAKIEYIHN